MAWKGNPSIENVLTKIVYKERVVLPDTEKGVGRVLEIGTFVPTRSSEVAEGMRVFDARFVYELKASGKETQQKSRLIA